MNKRTEKGSNGEAKGAVHRPRSFGRSILFTIIIVAVFFGLLELILAVIGVRPVLSDPFVGFAGNSPLFVEARQADGSILMKTPEHKIEFFNYQEFPKEKGKNTYRIFCMGGSTTVGHPYYDPLSFCGWLRLFVKAADPTRNWEVINAGGVSYASYRVAKLMEELKQYQPDLFIIYSGHNDSTTSNRLFLDNWLYRLNHQLTFRSVFYRFLSNRLGRLRKHFIYGHSGYAEKHYREEVIANMVYKKPELTDQDYARILEGYRRNMEAVIKIAKRHHVDILFSNLPSNLHDVPPIFLRELDTSFKRRAA